MTITAHRFQTGDIIKAKASGKFYVVERLRDDGHPKLKGRVGYSVTGLRDGKRFGPVRLMRESSFEITVYRSGQDLQTQRRRQANRDQSVTAVMPSPWNKTPSEWACGCGCWSPIGEPCWYCAEQKELAMSYRNAIEELAPAYDPRVIEAWMRSEHGTLDALSPQRFAAEVDAAAACAEAAGTRLNDAMVASFGL